MYAEERFSAAVCPHVYGHTFVCSVLPHPKNRQGRTAVLPTYIVLENRMWPTHHEIKNGHQALDQMLGFSLYFDEADPCI